MKRTLSAVLTVALIGSLFFAGFAGTAAAQDEIEIGNAEVDNEQEADAENNIEVNQQNNNAQLQDVSASSSSSTSYSVANGVQVQDVDQVNAANVEGTTAVASNYAESEATGVEIEFDFNDFMNNL